MKDKSEGIKPSLKDKHFVPPSGFEYRQPETGVKLNGFSFTDTVRIVIEHRKANSLDRQSLDEVTEDVETQMCHRVPSHFCNNCDHPDWELSGGSIVHAAQALGKVLEGAVTGQSVFVSQQEAERRAAICAKCFHNRDLAGCGIGCQLKEKMRDLFGRTIGERKTASDSKLFGCEVCGCHCRTIVWYNTDTLNSGLDTRRVDEFSQTPNCWRGSHLPPDAF